jgi:hypothetical protein
VASGCSSSPGLHALIEDIHALELCLQCHLQVVHIPGTLTIGQGTDGLSHGVWVSPFHDIYDQHLLSHSIFAPYPFDATLVQVCLDHLSVTCPWFHHPWDAFWDASSCFHQLTVWFPPPELARQILTLTTSFLFVVPRVVPAFWHSLSRHLQELPLLQPSDPWTPSPPLHFSLFQ